MIQLRIWLAVMAGKMPVQQSAETKYAKQFRKIMHLKQNLAVHMTVILQEPAHFYV